MFVANAIAHRFAEIRSECGGLREVEAAKSRQQARDRVLHDVGGIRRRSHPSRQAAVRDSLKTWNVSIEQPAKRVRIPEPGSCEKMAGRGGQRRVSRLAIRHAGLDRADDSAGCNNLYVA
jgi:hypothetical protein